MCSQDNRCNIRCIWTGCTQIKLIIHLKIFIERSTEVRMKSSLQKFVYLFFKSSHTHTQNINDQSLFTEFTKELSTCTLWMLTRSLSFSDWFINKNIIILVSLAWNEYFKSQPVIRYWVVDVHCRKSLVGILCEWQSKRTTNIRRTPVIRGNIKVYVCAKKKMSKCKICVHVLFLCNSSHNGNYPISQSTHARQERRREKNRRKLRKWRRRKWKSVVFLCDRNAYRLLILSPYCL